MAELKNCNGFTIVEFLVAILLTSIIMGAIYGVYRVQTHSVKAQETRLEAQEYARAALDMMVREIRNAGYAPTGAACVGVLTANAQTLRFTYDADGNGNCLGDNEDIEYRFDATGCSSLGNIMRKTVSPALDEALTDCNAPSGDFSFVYYPKQTGATAPPPYCYPLQSNPSGCSGDVAANLANIQRIAITVTVQSKNTEAEFGGGQLNAKVTSNTDLRNRGLPQ